KTIDGPVRKLLFDCLNDRDSYQRHRAMEALKKVQITEDEAEKVEALLSRKDSATRQAALGLLKKQKLDAALASADRMLAAKKAPRGRPPSPNRPRPPAQQKEGPPPRPRRGEKDQAKPKGGRGPEPSPPPPPPKHKGGRPPPGRRPFFPTPRGEPPP